MSSKPTAAPPAQVAHDDEPDSYKQSSNCRFTYSPSRHLDNIQLFSLKKSGCLLYCMKCSHTSAEIVLNVWIPYCSLGFAVLKSARR